MSFLTEYFDEFREHPIRKTYPCRPEARYLKFEGRWLDPSAGKDGREDKEPTDAERVQFIKDTLKSMRGYSVYYGDYCAHLPEDLKTRPFVERVKKKPPCFPSAETKEEEPPPPPPMPKLDIQDTELMKVAKELYGKEKDPDYLTLKPLDTHYRILGYVRPSLYHTGLSEYQGGISKLAYELIRDNKLPKYVHHNGGRPHWGIPPEGIRQPELDIIPFEGERNVV